MSVLSPDTIAQKHKKELASLKHGAQGVLTKLLLIFSIGVFVLILLAAFRGSQLDSSDSFTPLSRISAASEWDREFLVNQDAYSNWLARYTSSLERNYFDHLSEFLYHNAARFTFGTEEGGFLKNIYLGSHSALLRIAFLLMASWRVCLVVALATFLLARSVRNPFMGENFLGQTGNSRLFFSGMRVSLEDVNNKGKPCLQVTGLACPQMVPREIAKKSSISHLLTRFDALNETNMSLVGVILRYPEYPAYVAEREEQGLLEEMFEGAALGDSTLKILECVLSVQAEYHSLVQQELANVPNLSGIRERTKTGQKWSLNDYVVEVRHSLHRVLTPHMREEIGRMPPAQLATVVLAYQAGLVLTYAQEAGKWLRKSRFSELSARAVLHAMPSYAQEYSVDERSDIRRALIYGSRRSVFAPVRFPVDLTLTARAVRQWVEVLMACPHELQLVSDDVELVGMVYEAHHAWHTAFLDGVVSGKAEIVDGGYATTSNLFLMPLTSVLQVFHSVLEPSIIRRIEALLASVSQRSKLHAMSLELRNVSPDHASSVLDERIPAPLSSQEMKELALCHTIPLQTIRDWSALRVVLTSYGWLARRVGDSTVPESSVVFSVLKVAEPNSESNQLGLIGKGGMVPFRATKLVSRFGRQWGGYFKQVDSAHMAETREDYERLLKGIEEAPEPEPSGGTAAVA